MQIIMILYKKYLPRWSILFSEKRKTKLRKVVLQKTLFTNTVNMYKKTS